MHQDRSALTSERSDQLSQIFERIADGFIALDDQWRFTYVNSRAEEILQKERSALLGNVIWEVFPESVGSRFHEAYTCAMREQTSVSFEEYYAPLDMWASVHVLPSPSGLSIYLSDITAKKQTESALAQSEGQLRAVIDNSPAVIYMKDLGGQLIRVNDEFVDYYGTTKEQVLGKSDFELLPRAMAEAVRQHDQEVVERGVPMSFEEETMNARGVRRIYISSKFPLKDASGRIYGTAGISTDITERKRQEEALRASEERFRRVFDDAPIGMALADREFKMARVNDRLAEMLGYSKEELVGATFADVSEEGPDLEKNLQLAQQLMAEEIPRYRIEKQYRRKDGTVFWATLTGALIGEAGGEKYILGMVEDISARKQNEAALREKDRQIRQAYTDVIGAVTGGKLVLVAPDEMDDALGAPVSETWQVDEYAQFSEVRSKLRLALEEAGLTGERAESYVLAASEAFTNAVKHAGSGRVCVRRCEDAVQVEVSDDGAGIDFDHLPKATLIPGFSTAQTLGMGFTIMLDICDRLLLTTQPRQTRLALEASLRPEHQEVQDHAGTNGAAGHPQEVARQGAGDVGQGS